MRTMTWNPRKTVSRRKRWPAMWNATEILPNSGCQEYQVDKDSASNIYMNGWCNWLAVSSFSGRCDFNNRHVRYLPPLIMTNSNWLYRIYQTLPIKAKHFLLTSQYHSSEKCTWTPLVCIRKLCGTA